MILNWLLKRPPKSQPAPKTKAPDSPKPQQEKAADPLLSQKTRLLEKCMEVLCEKFPTKNSFAVNCDYPGTDNRATLYVEPDGKDPALRRLSTRVVRKGTDLCVMHYIFKGTPEELTAYLSDHGHVPELLSSWQQLSDSVDKKN